MPEKIKEDILNSEKIDDKNSELDTRSQVLHDKLHIQEITSAHKRSEGVKKHFHIILVCITYTVVIFLFLCSCVYFAHIALPEPYRWLNRTNGLEKVELIFITIIVNLIVSFVVRYLNESSSNKTKKDVD